MRYETFLVLALGNMLPQSLHSCTMRCHWTTPVFMLTLSCMPQKQEALLLMTKHLLPVRNLSRCTWSLPIWWYWGRCLYWSRGLDRRRCLLLRLVLHLNRLGLHRGGNRGWLLVVLHLNRLGNGRCRLDHLLRGHNRINFSDIYDTLSTRLLSLLRLLYRLLRRRLVLVRLMVRRLTNLVLARLLRWWWCLLHRLGRRTRLHWLLMRSYWLLLGCLWGRLLSRPVLGLLLLLGHLSLLLLHPLRFHPNVVCQLLKPLL